MKNTWQIQSLHGHISVSGWLARQRCWFLSAEVADYSRWNTKLGVKQWIQPDKQLQFSISTPMFFNWKNYSHPFLAWSQWDHVLKLNQLCVPISPCVPCGPCVPVPVANPPASAACLLDNLKAFWKMYFWVIFWMRENFSSALMYELSMFSIDG